MYTTRDPPLEVRNAPGIAGVKKTEDVGWITFGASQFCRVRGEWEADVDVGMGWNGLDCSPLPKTFLHDRDRE